MGKFDYLMLITRDVGSISIMGCERALFIVTAICARLLIEGRLQRILKFGG